MIRIRNLIIANKHTRINNSEEIVTKLEPGSEERLVASRIFANDDSPLQFTDKFNLRTTLELLVSCFYDLHVYCLTDDRTDLDELKEICDSVSKQYQTDIFFHPRSY